MTRHEWLAERFEADRPRLRTVAYRMLGSLSEADDAVQEAWLGQAAPAPMMSRTWADRSRRSSRESA